MRHLSWGDGDARRLLQPNKCSPSSRASSGPRSDPQPKATKPPGWPQGHLDGTKAVPAPSPPNEAPQVHARGGARCVVCFKELTGREQKDLAGSRGFGVCNLDNPSETQKAMKGVGRREGEEVMNKIKRSRKPQPLRAGGLPPADLGVPPVASDTLLGARG